MTLSSTLKNTVKRAMGRANLSVVRSTNLESYKHSAAVAEKVEMLKLVSDVNLRRALDILDKSPSQINQDLFALEELGWKSNGFFVEFGATNGKTLSNTWLLEKEFGWTGILAEPARVWKDALLNSGRTAAKDFDCVWSESGQTLTFDEAEWSELSTISDFAGGDNHVRKNTRSYTVKTVSLNDLLDRHDAPRVIDYLSIDTEGSEYTILKNLDFAKYRFRCITCEHNFNEDREPIHDLLVANGYVRKHENLTKYDDWYVSHD